MCVCVTHISAFWCGRTSLSAVLLLRFARWCSRNPSNLTWQALWENISPSIVLRLPVGGGSMEQWVYRKHGGSKQARRNWYGWLTLPLLASLWFTNRTNGVMKTMFDIVELENLRYHKRIKPNEALQKLSCCFTQGCPPIPPLMALSSGERLCDGDGWFLSMFFLAAACRFSLCCSAFCPIFLKTGCRFLEGAKNYTGLPLFSLSLFLFLTIKPTF